MLGATMSRRGRKPQPPPGGFAERLKRGGVTAQEFAQRAGGVPLIGVGMTPQQCFQMLAATFQAGLQQLRGEIGPTYPRAWWYPTAVGMIPLPVQTQKGFQGP